MDLIDFDHGPQPRVPSGGGKVLRWRPGGDPTQNAKAAPKGRFLIRIISQWLRLVAGARNRLDLQLRLLTTVALERGVLKALDSSPECPLYP
jgi:hypothetical protein